LVSLAYVNRKWCEFQGQVLRQRKSYLKIVSSSVAQWSCRVLMIGDAGRSLQRLQNYTGALCHGRRRASGRKM